MANSPTSRHLVTFTVPLVPPSVNHYVKHTRRGHRYVTGEAQAFKLAVAVYGRGYHLRAKAYEVSIFVYFGRKQRGDVDNLAKCVLDGLVDAGIIHSDAAVQKLTLEKGRDPENARTEITVRAIGETR